MSSEGLYRDKEAYRALFTEILKEAKIELTGVEWGEVQRYIEAAFSPSHDEFGDSEELFSERAHQVYLDLSTADMKYEKAESVMTALNRNPQIERYSLGKVQELRDQRERHHGVFN